MTHAPSSPPDPRPALQSKFTVPRVRALTRQRLSDDLSRLQSHRLCLVVAPAGSGKTTLLAEFARQADIAVAWYRVDESDGTAAQFVAHLERALTTALQGLTGGWRDVDDALVA